MTRPDRWFSYDGDDGFRRHNSAEAAKACAQQALDDAGDVAGDDGWPPGTHTICWGEVSEEAAETVVHKHGPDCKSAEDDEEEYECTDGYALQFGYVSRFDLTPMAEAERDNLIARAEAAEAEVERLRAVLNKAVDDLPEWSAGALKHISPAEALADEVRMTLRAAVTA